ncbi:MAG TPA: zf-HC2 domain-containing protein [Acidobacteriota bacterium]|nr:zf-HC2 domain-containing protein [Acidobacteriota bacterium]
MRTCDQIQNDFVEALYGELDKHRRRSLQAHLKSCADCRREFESLRKTLEVMSQREHPAFSGSSAEADASNRDASPSEDRGGQPFSIESLQQRILRAARSESGVEAAPPISIGEGDARQSAPGAAAQPQTGAFRGSREAPSASSRPVTLSKSRDNWRWLMQMAAGLALVALGVVIGRITMDGTYSPSGQPADLAQTTDGQPADRLGTATDQASDAPSPDEALARRVGGYVSRSQSLLVGLANMDTESDGIEAIDLDPQRQLSRSLLTEASYLRDRLDGRESRELVELIADLESILRQIANLEARHDLEGIEIIQEGVESSGILIKIQLQKIRPHPLVPERNRKKKDAA